ncbi:MAG: hypothetical protein GYB50_21270 [Rhodobacteraceae bacterium]|nr:hypothetical protein [Paracoccaceae bacterium]
MNWIPDPFPWSSILTPISSIVLSFGGFVIGIRSGKNNRDRGHLRDIYKGLYTHFDGLKYGLERGVPKQWEGFPLENNEYAPPVKAMKRDGSIHVLPDKLAAEMLDAEAGALLTAWKWKGLAEGGVRTNVEGVFAKYAKNYAAKLRSGSYRPIRTSNLMIMSTDDLTKIIEDVREKGIGLGVELSIVGGRTELLRTSEADLDGVDLLSFALHLKEACLSVNGSQEISKEVAAQVKCMDDVLRKLSKRIKDPHPFWASVAQAFRDPFQ